MQPCEWLWVSCYLVILCHKSRQAPLWGYWRNSEEEDSANKFATICNKSNPDLQSRGRGLQGQHCGKNFLLHLQERHGTGYRGLECQTFTRQYSSWHQKLSSFWAISHYTIKDHFFSALPTGSDIALTLKPNDYATYIFGGFWWLVLVDSINLEEKDVTHGSSCIPMVQQTIFIGSVLMIWDMYPSISSLWLLKLPNVQAVVDSSSLRSKNLRIQIVFLKIWNNISLIIWRYIQPFEL